MGPSGTPLPSVIVRWPQDYTPRGCFYVAGVSAKSPTNDQCSLEQGLMKPQGGRVA